MASRSKSANQLQDYKDIKLSKGEDDKLTTETGAPMETKTATMSLGHRGPLLLRDNNFIEEMSHFDRERIPERVVHAKGAGAFGYFQTTHDVSQYTKLSPFSEVGKKTPLAVRFSTVGGESGSADTARDPRGFAIKFYSDEGIWDLVGNNTPIFFIRDPILFPSFIHTQKRNPTTHLKDPDMFWDFISLRPETTHQVMFLFSNRGTPDGYRHMNGYGSHTFKLINAEGKCNWCKFHFKTDQGIKNFRDEAAGKMAGQNPDYALQDLFDSIANEDYPSWSCYLQIMSLEQAEKHPDNPFDVTKVWPHCEYPLIPVGKMVLNRNPKNYFAEVEQIAFSPAHMIPGVATSPDKMLQGRLFSYGDTHRHRLGTNYQQIPVNCPLKAVKNYQRDGPNCIFNQQGAPNYFPNSFSGPAEQRTFSDPIETYTGDIGRYQTGDEDNFSQPKIFWTKVLDEQERSDLVSNMAGHLMNAQESIRQRTINNFTSVHADFGQRLQEAINNNLGVADEGNQTFLHEDDDHLGEYATTPFDKEAFLLAVQQFPCLWNTYCKEFRDRNLKQKAWSMIAKAFNENSINLQRVLKNLKENLKRCIDKRNTLIKSGAPTSSLPKCKYFEVMRYLIIHTNTILPVGCKQLLLPSVSPLPLPSASPLPLPLPLPLTTSLPSPEESSTQDGKYIVRKRRHCDDDLSSNSSFFAGMKCINDNIIQSINNNRQLDDEATSYCKSLIPQLQSLPPKKKRYAKFKICQLLYDIEYEDA